MVSIEAKRRENMFGHSSHTQSFSGISQGWPFSFLAVDKKKTQRCYSLHDDERTVKHFQKIHVGKKRTKKIKKDPWQSWNKGMLSYQPHMTPQQLFTELWFLEIVWWFISSHSFELNHNSYRHILRYEQDLKSVHDQISTKWTRTCFTGIDLLYGTKASPAEVESHKE